MPSRLLLAFMIAITAAHTGCVATPEVEPSYPNVIVIFIDDMGYGDLGCYGLEDAPTPNIDALADQGLRLTQFYVNAPICSPSRVALNTGQYPQRWGINNYIASREQNSQRGVADYLDPEAPTMARMFSDAGYATAHFGKWHMGGGRDVGDAPLPQAYGFHESLVCFEGLGDRVLISNDGLSRRSADLGNGEIAWANKHELTGIYVDRAIDFIGRSHETGRPFYVHVFPNDVHDPFIPAQADLQRYADFSDDPRVQNYYAVIDAMDRELGRLFAHLDEAGLADNTIVILTSDNGPTAWPSYYRDGGEPPGWTGGLRGRKWSLYEGGIREPFIVRWPSHVPEGEVDEQTVMAAIDLMPTLAAMAGGDVSAQSLGDGMDRSAAMLGDPIPDRGAPIFWEYGISGRSIRPGLEVDRSPILAMRDGDWKLLMNPDGQDIELYNLADDPGETANLAQAHRDRVRAMRQRLHLWWAGMPIRAVEAE